MRNQPSHPWRIDLPHIWRFSFPKGIVTVFLCLLTVSKAQSLAERPNVLFIMADDLNTSLSGFGQPHCQSPHLDRLAESGVTFTHAYSQFPICGPSRASLFSGQYPEKNGVTGNGGELHPDRVTLPLHFKNNGYWTGRVSKIYHMGVPGDILQGRNGRDHAASWVERYNVTAMEAITPGKAEDLTGPDSTPLYPQLREKWQRQKHSAVDFKVPGNHMGSDFVVTETADDNTLLADGMAADNAIELLRERAGSEQPFFLAVGFVRPHSPYIAPERDFSPYNARQLPIPIVPENDAEDFPPHLKPHSLSLNKLTHQKVLRGYYASIGYMDRQVGRLLAELDRLDLRKNTIVVFSSDHGYLHGEHRMWKKKLLWEEAIRTPVIISAPNQKSRGTKCAQLVELIDLYPTVVELAGLQPEPGAQGHSLRPLLDNPLLPHTRRDAFSQTHQGYCLRTGHWAYMWYPATKNKQQGSMLYDLSIDPKQHRNLTQAPSLRTFQMNLQRRLQERINQARAEAHGTSLPN